MNASEQRVAIALAAGFKGEDCHVGRYFYNPDSPLCQDGRMLWDAEELPDYLNSLDAMHEAEKVLQGEQINDYLCHLCDLEPNSASMYMATAAQRCEAFLKTLSLWKPDEK